MSQTAHTGGSQPRCPGCGIFCHVVYEWMGAFYGEVLSCPNENCKYPDRRGDQ